MTRELIKGIKFKHKSNELNPTEIAEAIEQGFLMQRRPSKPFTQKKTFSPSTIGYGHGNCARFWFLAFTGTDSWQDDVDAMGAANMSLGNAVHDEIQAAMKAAGLLIEAELEITMESPPIRGYLDALLNWHDEEIIAEIKTTRQESFVFKEASGKPSPNHLIQLLLYLKATGHKRGFILYVNKNDSTYLVIPVELTPENEEIIDGVLEWLRTTRAAYEANTIPQIPFTRARNSGEPSNKVCRSCPVQKDCFSRVDEGQVMIPLMEVPKL